MNQFIVVFLAALACANAGLLAAPAAGILQGPSTRTTVAGPDGSVISAVAPGGTVVTHQTPAVVAAAAPALVAAPALAARSVWNANTVLAGPSGTISTSQPLAAQAWAAPLAVNTWAAQPWAAQAWSAPLATAALW